MRVVQASTANTSDSKHKDDSSHIDVHGWKVDLLLELFRTGRNTTSTSKRIRSSTGGCRRMVEPDCTASRRRADQFARLQSEAFAQGLAGIDKLGGQPSFSQTHRATFGDQGQAEVRSPHRVTSLETFLARASEKDDAACTSARNRLECLRHASHCSAGAPGDRDNHEEQCTFPRCKEMRELWRHLRLCEHTNCSYPLCTFVTWELRHLQVCRDRCCSLCGSLKASLQTPPCDSEQLEEEYDDAAQEGLRFPFKRDEDYEDSSLPESGMLEFRLCMSVEDVEVDLASSRWSAASCARREERDVACSHAANAPRGSPHRAMEPIQEGEKLVDLGWSTEGSHSAGRDWSSCTAVPTRPLEWTEGVNMPRECDGYLEEYSSDMVVDTSGGDSYESAYVEDEESDDDEDDGNEDEDDEDEEDEELDSSGIHGNRGQSDYDVWFALSWRPSAEQNVPIRGRNRAETAPSCSSGEELYSVGPAWLTPEAATARYVALHGSVSSEEKPRRRRICGSGSRRKMSGFASPLRRIATPLVQLRRLLKRVRETMRMRRTPALIMPSLEEGDEPPSWFIHRTGVGSLCEDFGGEVDASKSPWWAVTDDVPSPRRTRACGASNVVRCVEGSSCQGGGGGSCCGDELPAGDVILEQQQKLLILLNHARSCDAASRGGATGAPCEHSQHCQSVLQLWRHVAACRDATCSSNLCRNASILLRHLYECRYFASCGLCWVVCEMGTLWRPLNNSTD